MKDDYGVKSLSLLVFTTLCYTFWFIKGGNYMYLSHTQHLVTISSTDRANVFCLWCSLPSHPNEQQRKSLIVSIHCITFTVIQMDGLQVPKSNNTFKLLHHTTEAFLCWNIITCAKRRSRLGISMKYNHKLWFWYLCNIKCNDTHLPTLASFLPFHGLLPAANMWHVSKQTPMRVLSWTLFMISRSSSNFPPTVFPWQHMFSITTKDKNKMSCFVCKSWKPKSKNYDLGLVV